MKQASDIGGHLKFNEIVDGQKQIHHGCHNTVPKNVYMLISTTKHAMLKKAKDANVIVIMQSTFVKCGKVRNM